MKAGIHRVVGAVREVRLGRRRRVTARSGRRPVRKTTRSGSGDSAIASPRASCQFVQPLGLYVLLMYVVNGPFTKESVTSL